MKRNVLSSLLIALLSFAIRADAQQVLLFSEYLEPASEELNETLKKTKAITPEFDALIAELKAKAYQTDSKIASKTDLAAHLVRRVAINADLPYEQNEPFISEAADLLPGNFVVEVIWGDLFFYSKDYENAISHYENALNVHPDNIETIGKAGLSYMFLMNYEKALENIDQYLTKFPDAFFFLYSAGNCNMELRQYDEAITKFEAALEVCNNPQDKKDIESLISKAREALASTSDSSSEEDQRFVITFAGNSRDDLSDVTFDMLDEIYYDVTNLVNYNPDVKINIVFFLTEDYYQNEQNWSAAAAQGIQIMVPLKTGYKNQEYVKGLLAHEFTHTLINLKTQNRCPIWIHEGLAQYQEYTTSYGSPDTIRSDFESVLQNDFIENQLFIPLDKVGAYIGSSDSTDIVRGYVASYMAMRCMADFYGEQSFDSLLSELGKGKSLNESIQEATGKSYSEFQDEYKEWLRNQ